MSRIHFDKDIQPLSEFRAGVASYIKQINETRRPLVITQRGKGVAVVLDVAEYEAMQEKIELLEELRMAEAQLSSGAGVSNNDARAQVLARIDPATVADMPAETLRPLVSREGSLTANRNANSLVVADFADNIRRIRALASSIDRDSSTSQIVTLKNAGARAVAMEVSSHGLHQGRVAALAFDVAVFTNLSRDHLDYHGSMDAYGEAKAALFAWSGLRCRVLNLDDAFGRELAEAEHPSRLIGYSLENPAAYLYCRDIRFDEQGVRATLVTPRGEGHLRSSLLGRFNLSNLLAVVGALLGMDYALDEILKLLPQLQGPVGRMQRLGGVKQPLLVVDYAHTPDALEKVLEALRPHVKGRLLCLFGCGGDRDRGKRPLMAAVVERLADGVLVTDDNPRSEPPEQIFNDIRAGFANPEAVQFVHGRGQAIAQLVAAASADDVLVLAGKGHEDYQEINGERQPFSDLIEAGKALAVWEVAHA